MNEIGIISEVRGNKARVAIGSMVSDFLPVFQSFANSFGVSFSPIRVGEQVLVLPVRGELNSGVILRGLFQNSHKTEPTDKKVHFEFEDGAKFSYDTSTKSLEIKGLNSVNVIASAINLNGNLNVSGVISDSKGDLTNHSHKDSDGATSLPR